MEWRGCPFQERGIIWHWLCKSEVYMGFSQMREAQCGLFFSLRKERMRKNTLFLVFFFWLKADRMEPGIISQFFHFKKMEKKGKNRDLIYIYLALFFWPNWKQRICLSYHVLRNFNIFPEVGNAGLTGRLNAEVKEWKWWYT